MSPKGLPNETAANPNSLKRQIVELRRTIRRLRKDDRLARRDIAKRGAFVTAIRLDSNGAPHEKTVPNPFMRVSREIGTTLTTYTRKLAALECEYESALQSAEAKADGAGKYDF